VKLRCGLPDYWKAKTCLVLGSRISGAWPTPIAQVFRARGPLALTYRGEHQKEAIETLA